MASSRDFDTASIASTAVKIKDPVKKAWCQTQWTNLSHQARKIYTDDYYFDLKTMLLDKTTNKKLWQLTVGHEINHQPGYLARYFSRKSSADLLTIVSFTESVV